MSAHCLFADTVTACTNLFKLQNGMQAKNVSNRCSSYVLSLKFTLFFYAGIGFFVLACETAKKPICFIDLLWFEFWDGHEPLNKTALLTTPDTFAMDLRHSALFLYFQGYCVSTDIQERVVWGKFTGKKEIEMGVCQHYKKSDVIFCNINAMRTSFPNEM